MSETGADADGAVAVETLGEVGLWHFPPYLMNRIMGRYNAGLQDKFRARGLTTPKVRIMAVLAVLPGVTVNDLSIYAVLEQSTTSRTVDALEAASLIHRVESESDGRVRRVFLTDLGQRNFQDVWPEMYAAHREMFDGISDDEKAAFVLTLQKILKNIRQNPI